MYLKKNLFIIPQNIMIAANLSLTLCTILGVTQIEFFYSDKHYTRLKYIDCLFIEHRPQRTYEINSA